MDSRDNAPAWLFSFVDLAFLLIIAMTQIGGGSGVALDLGEIIVPRIQAGAATDLPARSSERWQLRVHPPSAEPQTGGEATPFELLLPSTAGVEAPRVSAESLRMELAALHESEVAKPLLAPHADSRSQDMLDAVGLLEEFWPSRRRATVAPVFAR